MCTMCEGDLELNDPINDVCFDCDELFEDCTECDTLPSEEIVCVDCPPRFGLLEGECEECENDCAVCSEVTYTTTALFGIPITNTGLSCDMCDPDNTKTLLTGTTNFYLCKDN